MTVTNGFRVLALALCLTLSCMAAKAQDAGAEDIQTGYSEMDLSQCTLLETYEAGANFACPGYKGFPVWVAEGDLRFFVSYGFGAPEEMAAHQTLPPFNRLGRGIEWRLKREGDEWVPFATILRWITDAPEAGGDEGEFLIVTKIAPGDTCHIAYIDARRTPFANEAARQWADSLAPVFDCGKDTPDRVPD